MRVIKKSPKDMIKNCYYGNTIIVSQVSFKKNKKNTQYSIIELVSLDIWKHDRVILQS